MVGRRRGGTRDLLQEQSAQASGSGLQAPGSGSQAPGSGSQASGSQSLSDQGWRTDVEQDIALGQISSVLDLVEQSVPSGRTSTCTSRDGSTAGGRRSGLIVWVHIVIRIVAMIWLARLCSTLWQFLDQ